MAAFWALHLGLAELPVRIVGASYVPRRWTATVTSSEEVVALGLLTTRRSTSWFKSAHRGVTSIPVEISLQPPDALEGGHVVLNIGGYVATTFSPAARTITLEAEDASTSRPTLLATIDSGGPGPVELGMLLLARRDVQFKRNHLWRVRPERAPGLPEPFRTILVRGRSGTL
jgi:hypothetical protein